MKKHRIILSLILVFLIIPVILQPSSAQTYEWNFLSDPIKITNWWDNIRGVDMDTATNGSIHIVYRTNDTSNIETYYADNEGNINGNITSSVKIDDDIYYNYECAIAVDSNGNSHIIWEQHNGMTTMLYYTNNIGGSFMTPITVDYGATDTPDIAIDNAGTVWMVYNNLSGVWVRYYSSSLSPVIKIPGTVGTENNSRISANVYPHVVFDRGSGSGREIYYSKRIVGFSTAINITGDTSFECLRPDIFVDNSEIPYIVFQYNWPDYVESQSYEIFYSYNLQTAYSITYDSLNQTWPNIAVTNEGSVCVVYHTLYPTLDPLNPNEDIHLKIQNPGENFQTMYSNYINITTNPFSDYNPRISVDNVNNIHVVWYGYDGSTFNIFYNRGIKVTTTTTPIPGFLTPFIIGTLVLLICYKKYKN
jgi:hypothetical protein